MPYNLAVQCPECRKTYLPDLLVLDPAKFVKAWLEWQQPGINIQDAFPASQSRQREQLQTGICSDECWEKFLGPEQ